MLKNAHGNPLCLGKSGCCVSGPESCVIYKREEPILTVFSLHYIPEDKALNMSLLYFERSHFFCTEHVRLVRFNLLLTFTLEFSLFILPLCVQLAGLLVSFWQEYIILHLYVHDSPNSAQEQWMYDC